MHSKSGFRHSNISQGNTGTQSQAYFYYKKEHFDDSTIVGGNGFQQLLSVNGTRCLKFLCKKLKHFTGLNGLTNSTINRKGKFQKILKTTSSASDCSSIADKRFLIPIVIDR